MACVVLPAGGSGIPAISRGTGMCLYGHWSQKAREGTWATWKEGKLVHLSLGHCTRGWMGDSSDTKQKGGEAGGDDPCKSLLWNADGMRWSSLLLRLFQSISSMSRTHRSRCLQLGLSDTATRQEAGPESSQAGKRDGKRWWDTEAPGETYKGKLGICKNFLSYLAMPQDATRTLRDSNELPSSSWGRAQPSVRDISWDLSISASSPTYSKNTLSDSPTCPALGWVVKDKKPPQAAETWLLFRFTDLWHTSHWYNYSVRRAQLDDYLMWVINTLQPWPHGCLRNLLDCS